MGRSTILGVALESVFSTFFPADCRFCRSPLHRISRLPVCPSCLAAIAPLSGRTCTVCGERLFTRDGDDPICGECRFEAPLFRRALAYGGYEGGMRELIHLLKYERVTPAAGVLGRMLADVIGELAEDFGSDLPLVVPVPLHPAKARQRGFNQSELIAAAALKLLRQQFPRLVLMPRAMERVRATGSQTGLTTAQRRENMRGAFQVTRREWIAARPVLLVDDVYTTGATVTECARVLRRGGASGVWVATVARALKAEATGVEPGALAAPAAG